jgi:MFS family permease
MPVLAEDVFNISANAAGAMIAVPAGIGAAIGTLIVTHLLKKGWRKKRAIETSLKIMTLMLFVLTFILPEISSIFRLVVGLTSVSLLGFAFVGILIPSQTFLQEKTPGGMRGRVFGNYWFLATIATVFPVIFSGAITEILGIRFLLFILTAFTVAALIFSNKYGENVIKGKLIFYKDAK